MRPYSHSLHSLTETHAVFTPLHSLTEPSAVFIILHSLTEPHAVFTPFDRALCNIHNPTQFDSSVL